MSAAVIQSQAQLSPAMQLLLLQMLNLVAENITKGKSGQGNGTIPTLPTANVENEAQITRIIETLDQQSKILVEQANLIKDLKNHITLLEQNCHKGVMSLNGKIDDNVLPKEDAIFNKLEKVEELVDKNLNACDAIKQLHRDECKNLNSHPGNVSARVVPTAEIPSLLAYFGVDIMKRGFHQRTQLHLAAEEGQTDRVKALIKAGATIEDRDAGGDTPVFLAAWKGRVEAIRALADAGAHLNGANNAGWIILTLAAHHNHLEACRVLLEYGLDINQHDANEHLTALHKAAFFGHVDLVRFLLYHGADRERKTIHGKTPLDLARDKGHKEVITLLSASD